MSTTPEVSVLKADEMVDFEPKSGEDKAEKEKLELEKGNVKKEPKCVGKVQETAVLEAKTGVSFPTKLEDGKHLTATGVRKKSMLGIGIKIYAFARRMLHPRRVTLSFSFHEHNGTAEHKHRHVVRSTLSETGIYAENEKLKDVAIQKIGKAPAKPSKEMYQMVIDSDVAIVVRLVIVYSGITMSMVRKGLDEGLGAAMKKLTGGGKNQEITKKVMGGVSDDLKLTPSSLIEISRLPGYILQTKVMGKVVSEVNNELLCRAFVYLYLGDDPFDKESKEKFGASLLSLL